MHEAIGIVEMFGFVTAISAADAAAKAADVRIVPKILPAHLTVHRHGEDRHDDGAIDGKAAVPDGDHIV